MLYEASIFVGGVVVKAVIDVAVKRIAAGIGALHYVRRDCGFLASVNLEDGRTVEALTHEPDIAAPDSPAVTLTIRGELLNDSDATKILLAPRIIFVHVSGKHEIYTNPTLEVAGKEVASLSLPPRSSTVVTVRVPLPKSSLDNYAQTLPLLEFGVPGKEKKVRFRASGVSFYGEPSAFWPKEGDTPVVYEHLSSTAS